MKYASLYRVWGVNTKMATRRLDWVQIPKKLTKGLLDPQNYVYRQACLDKLRRLFTCRWYTSPGESLVTAKQQSANIDKLHFPWYRLITVQISRWICSPSSPLSTPQFSGKDNPGEKAENASLLTYWSPIADITTAGFLQVPFNYQPCCFLDIWLLQARNHSTPSSRYNWECGRTPRLRRAGGYEDRRKTLSLIFAALIPGNFSVRHLDARPVWSITLTKFFYSLSFICREGSKMLLDSTSSRAVHSFFQVPMTVEKASSSSCSKKSLLWLSL